MTLPAQDLYPSRTNGVEKVVARQDPTVFAREALDDERVRAYDKNGYLQLDALFDARELRALQAEASRLLADQNRNADSSLIDSSRISRAEIIVEPGSNSIRSIFDVQRFSALFDRLIRDERLVDWARRLLGDEVYLHQSRLNYKPAFSGKEFYWHSDFETWHVEDGMPRMRALSMSIALTENRACNGPVMVIPGSHQFYVSCAGQTPEKNYEQSLRRQDYGVPSRASLEQLVEGREIAVVTGAAGSVLMFDCNTMHGSAGNITPYARTNLFFVYNAVSNRLQKPYSGQEPRPEYIARRAGVEPITPVRFQPEDYCS